MFTQLHGWAQHPVPLAVRDNGDRDGGRMSEERLRSRIRQAGFAAQEEEQIIQAHKDLATFPNPTPEEFRDALDFGLDRGKPTERIAKVGILDWLSARLTRNPK